MKKTPGKARSSLEKSVNLWLIIHSFLAASAWYFLSGLCVEKEHAFHAEYAKFFCKERKVESPEGFSSSAKNLRLRRSPLDICGWYYTREQRNF
jgi:hypothetical protein